ncbi:MAG: hypothetical protein WBW33_07140, partial [Bryobacteraceae bacterium]
HSISKWPDWRAPLLQERRTTSRGAVLTTSASFSPPPTGARISNVSRPYSRPGPYKAVWPIA